MKPNSKATKPITFLSLLLAFLFVFTPLVVAVEPTNPQDQDQTRLETRGAKEATPGAKGKLQACQKKQATIRNRSQQVIRRANLIMNRFDRITTRVKEYYNNRLVSKGITLENYDQMLANIEAKKKAANDALDVAKATAASFTCDKENPRAQVQAFRQDMISVIRALKEYKKSVIDFLVAVRTKGKLIKAPAATPSATPSAK